jgi:23S rRNA U2552 (ribose-2'-O)-methylase RlmE/FtsJ
VGDVTEIKQGIGDQAAGIGGEKDIQREGGEEREGERGPSASAGSSGTRKTHKAPTTTDEQDPASPTSPAFPSAQCLVPNAFFSVVLSDMAPDTTGSGDAFLSERLCRTVLDLLPAVLRPGGNLAMKVLEGEPYPALLRDTAVMFASCKGLKPKATRDVSREIYIVGLGYKGPTR